MGKNFKKYITIFLAVLMLVSAIPAQLFAASVKDPWVTQTSNS